MLGVRVGVRTCDEMQPWGEVNVLVSNRAKKFLAVRNPPPAQPAHVIFLNVYEVGKFCARDRVFVLGGTLPQETVKFKQASGCSQPWFWQIWTLSRSM